MTMTRQGWISPILNSPRPWHPPRRLRSAVLLQSRRLLLAAVFVAVMIGGVSRLHAAQDASKDVPADVQQMIEDYFQDRFVYPDTTEWHFDFIAPYPGSERIVCGTVNYENARRQYVGEKHFFAIFNRKGVNSIGITQDENEDRLGEGAFKLKTLCHLP